MGDPRIVEIVVDQRGVFGSRTLVPNIMHATHESRAEGSRRYTTLNLGGRFHGNSTFIDWNTDTLMIGNDQTLCTMFRPGNINMLSQNLGKKIAIHDSSVPLFLGKLLVSDAFNAMEELYVVRPTPSTRMGVGNLEFAGKGGQDPRFRELLRTRDGFRAAVTVDAIRDVRRLLEGGERDERDKRRRLERQSNMDMLHARRSVK
jgi:hypothetical protein